VLWKIKLVLQKIYAIFVYISRIGANNIYCTVLVHTVSFTALCESTNVQSENNYFLRFWSAINNKARLLKQRGEEDFSSVPNSEFPIAGIRRVVFRLACPVPK
uniref:Uncharacterized protein n=1 Tax=Gasterosteus aculeatus TaxID=69293 RepID=G3PEC8_GASAC